MKVASLLIDGVSRTAVAGDDDRWNVIDANEEMPWLRSVKSLIENWSSTSQSKLLEYGRSVDDADLLFLCPLTAIQKIVCVGKNYVGHAQEMGGSPPEIPVIFNKLPSALIGNNDSVVLPSISQKVDFEAELVVVIAKTGRNISRQNANDYIFGYTIGNDVTARDWQKGRPGGQWLLGKTFDTFAPLGPYIVTSDSIKNPNALDIELKLNGTTMQIGNTANMIFSIDRLIEHISKFVTLFPGDLLFTGTPAGVGAARQPEVYLKSGDQMEISISGIGILTNTVISENTS